MSKNSKIKTIPHPQTVPLLKNILDLDAAAPIQSMMRLARQYGPIFRLDLTDFNLLVISSQELINELCDEKRFDKKVHKPLENIRDFAGDGLFTADTKDHNWQKAHRILMPAFGPAFMRDMFDAMLDITQQMLVKWERFGEKTSINVSESMTRLTLDTIALCAFDYRFNSFYQNEMHPFVDAMIRSLGEASAKTRRLSLQNRLMLFTQRQYDEDIHYMLSVANNLITERRRDPNGQSKKDLLNLMLTGRDPVTREGLSDENIQYQMVTFLIAGHETTSGLLSFAIYAY